MSKKLKLLAALVTVGAAATLVAAALATSFDPNGNYVSIAGTNLHQTPPIANTSVDPDCTAAELASLPPGGVLWHFVLVQSSATSGLLRTDFQTAGLTVPDVPSNPGGGVLDWNVITPTADTLLNASTDKDGGLLNLSHVCYVRQVTPTVVTEIHLDPTHNPVTTVNLGDKVHDSATVTSTAGTPTGTVDFKFYSGQCGDDSHQIGSTSNVPVVNGVADPSAASAALAAGSYHYTAHYNSDKATWTSGDADCEPLTVSKAQLTIVTQIHKANHDPVGGNTHVPLGSVVHDTATVTGQVPGFDPTGAISFTLDGNPVTKANPAEAGFTASTVDSAPLAAGSYTYAASVADDSNYIGDISDDEPLTVDKAQLTIVTQIHNGSHQDITNTNVPAGTVVHDTATVTGDVPGFPVNPVVTFTLNGNPVANGAAESGFAARTVDSAPLAPGSYVYKATVADSANYIGDTSDDEPLSVFTFGKTMGFWGNTNGQAALPANPNVTLGTVSATTCSIVVNTKAISKIILPDTKNGVSILTNCTTTASRDPGINTGSLNTLLAQTLALSFNILYIQGYTGQTIGGMNCTPVGSLTLASTVQAARDYANGLIANAKLGGTVVTQSQIGALNTLLGCLNRES